MNSSIGTDSPPAATSPCLGSRAPAAQRPSLANLPPELVNLVLLRLKELARHPADRHWTLSQVMSVYPLYSSLSDSHHFSLLADPRYDSIVDNVRQYSVVFDAACEMAGTHFHHGGPMADSSSDSESDDQGDSSSGSSRSGSSSPNVVGQAGSRRLSSQMHLPESVLVSPSPSVILSPSSPQAAGGVNTFAPVFRKSRPSLPPDRTVSALAIPQSVPTSLARLKNIEKLSIVSTSTIFDAATVSAMGQALQLGLEHPRLVSLSIDLSSHPGDFLRHIVSLSTAALHDMTLRFSAPTGDQSLANCAAVELIRRARNLRSLSITCREISITLLTEIAKCSHLGTLELRGEIVDSQGQTFDQLWPEITPSLSSTLSRRDPGSIHTLRLFLTGGHEPLISTIFLNLNRPLQVLEWPVHLASRVYGHLIIRTQSFLLQCPHRLASMYYDAILTDASSSPILTHMQLHGYPGREPPPHPMVYLQSLELIDVPPVDVAHLLASGAFPSLHALVVRVNDHAMSAYAPWLLALLDRNVCVGLGLAGAAQGLSPLTSLSVQFALPAGARLDRVRQVVGYRVDTVVPYVARVEGVAVAHLVAALAGANSGIVFPWMPTPAAGAAGGAGGLEVASDEDGAGARQVRVHATYRERPNWTHESSVAIVLDVRLAD